MNEILDRTNYILVMLISCILIPGLQRYCTYESFTAKCRNQDVIIMRKAIYGYMGVGRCAIHDFGMHQFITKVPHIQMNNRINISLDI